MAAVLSFWNTNMADVKSCGNSSANILVISRVGSEPCHNWLNDSKYQHNNTNDSMSTRYLTVEKRREGLGLKRTDMKTY